MYLPIKLWRITASVNDPAILNTMKWGNFKDSLEEQLQLCFENNRKLPIPDSWSKLFVLCYEMKKVVVLPNSIVEFVPLYLHPKQLIIILLDKQGKGCITSNRGFPCYLLDGES